MQMNKCPECGSRICMTIYDQPPKKYKNVLPGYVFRCECCGLRHDAWSYDRPFSIEKAVRHWNHHSSIWPGYKARERRKIVSLGSGNA